MYCRGRLRWTDQLVRDAPARFPSPWPDRFLCRECMPSWLSRLSRTFRKCGTALREECRCLHPDSEDGGMIVAIGFDPHGCRLRRVLHGILQKIAYDAAHRLAIGFDENPSLDGRHLDVMTVRARLALIIVDAGADQFRKIDSFKP